ncbi:MAG: hypothetical protein PVJ53_04800, partial [Desulfobacterales bacterium]
SYDFADEMIEASNARESDACKDAHVIAWATIDWAAILEGWQLKYFREAKRRPACPALERFGLACKASPRSPTEEAYPQCFREPRWQAAYGVWKG